MPQSKSVFIALLVVASAQVTTGQKQVPGINELKDLVKIDKQIGTGKPIQNGDTVYVEYSGRIKDGTEFDSNRKANGNPLSFEVGKPGIIEGWNLGVIGMKLGGVRELQIPAKLGYGNQGSGEIIKPGADLYFNIKVLYILRPGEENYFDRVDSKVGTGRAVKSGDLIDVNYVGKLVNGRKFDDRSDPAKVVKFRVGTKKVQPTDRLALVGLSAAIQGMKVGGKRTITLPPALAFGQMSRNGVPPNSVLIFDVELKKIY